METRQLLKRNLFYYWQTNLAVVAGVAIAVAVLAGALLVGDSVRASLRELFIGRLGNADYVITGTGFFREQLATDINNHQRFTGEGFNRTSALIALQGTITHEATNRIVSNVNVYAVDDTFWAFHGYPNQPQTDREIYVGDVLARELGSQSGDSLVLRIQKPSAIPVESLLSKKEDLGKTLRLTMREPFPAGFPGEFSLQPQQGPSLTALVSLKMLQKELEQEGRVNLILVDASSNQVNTTALEHMLKETASLEDYGIKLKVLNEQQELSVESAAGLVSDTLVESIQQAAQSAKTNGGYPYLSYLVNSIRKDDGRAIPYSIVTSVDEKLMEYLQHDQLGHRSGCDATLRAGMGRDPRTAHLHPLILNDWAAKDLGVGLGERVTLDYYLWLEEGQLVTRSTEFRVACVIPMEGLAADPDLVPEYPGITEAETFREWDPPFPVDLQRIRPQDEEYWKQHRTTPKAFIALPVGQELWKSRFGQITSLRVAPGRNQTFGEAEASFKQNLQATLDPVRGGFSILPVRAQGLEASRGATDFGEYFLYFSFFLVVAALLLAALFFKLGVEQRLREIGVLQAVGFPAANVRRLFLIEGLVLSVIGTLIGLAGAIGYGQLMMTGLTTWWVDAVGTRLLKLHVGPLSLVLGAVGGVAAAVVCIVWTLRRLRRKSTRSLLTGTLEESGIQGQGEREKGRRRDNAITPSPRHPVSPSPRLLIAITLTVLGAAFLVAAFFQIISQTVGFFGGGVLLLAALICYQSAWLRGQPRNTITKSGWWGVSRLGFRNAAHRPGRSVLCIALIASAAFIIVSVDAFRRKDGAALLDRKSGTGGYPLLAESLLPLVHDPSTAEGRDALNLAREESVSLSNVTFTRFRVRPGDDASCLNLYQPRNPRIIAPADEFIQSNRFSFSNSLATTSEEKNNPWLLLNREFPDGAVPVIADANSLTYVLHLKIGDDFVMNRPSGPLRLRVVGSLADSILQSEFLMSEKNFLRLFPEQEGYRFFLIDTPEHSQEIATALEDRLSDFGFDVVSTAERLANFHRVENTYLSTFQMLGGLGLLLGTLGLAAILLRNVLERRRELALLRAIGYNSSHFTLMVFAENAWLLFCGLVTGTVCALLAIAPAFLERGGRLPNISLGFLLLAVLISGLIASLVATWAALRSPLLPALRAE
ncbi:MAG TPA: FtsX-like permease family protein [Pyrinomonadaceae bacterium]|nr:FtsX-like permease family protein [Pyrinomonadaceae bacterium]